MPELKILCRMCDDNVNKAVYGLAAILLVRLVGQPPKNVKNEICLLYENCTFKFW